MKKNFSVKIIAGFLVVFLAAFLLYNQQYIFKEEAEVQELPSSKDGVQIKTEKDTYTTTTDKIVLVIINNSEEALGGTSFEVEKKVEGQWYNFPLKESGPIDTIGG